MKESLLEKYSPNSTTLLANLVACTGNQFCGQAIAETEARSLELTLELDTIMETSPRPHSVAFHWMPQLLRSNSGCGYWIHGNDGTRRESEARGRLRYLYCGAIGSDSHLGELVRRGMTGIQATQLLPVVQELMIEHFGAKRKA